jgi:hypothetical protein
LILRAPLQHYWTHLTGIGSLENSLWAWDGRRVRIWLDALTIEKVRVDARAKENESSRYEKDDSGDVEIVGRVAETCRRNLEWISVPDPTSSRDNSPAARVREHRVRRGRRGRAQSARSELARAKVSKAWVRREPSNTESTNGSESRATTSTASSRLNGRSRKKTRSCPSFVISSSCDTKRRPFAGSQNSTRSPRSPRSASSPTKPYHLRRAGQIPNAYLAAQYPIRYAAISSDARLIAVAGQRGFAKHRILG